MQFTAEARIGYGNIGADIHTSVRHNIVNYT